MPLAAIGILLFTLVIGTPVVVLSLRKRFAKPQAIVGQCGHVDTALTPQGTVIVRGELWPARSVSGVAIKSRERIRVVSLQDLLLLVETSD